MEGRRWEELEMDCLVNIFQRLGLEDITLGVPFVCKPWFKASLDPLCWKVLSFRELDFMPWSNFTKRFTNQYCLRRFSPSGFIKFAINRSRGSVIELVFPTAFVATLDDLIYASNKCPELKTIVCPNLMSQDEIHIPALVGKWKDLERLEMESKPSSFLEMLSLISLNCKKFVGLRMLGSIKNEDALAIVNFLPKLKYLNLSKSYLPKKELLVIMDGCKELERLIVTKCVGFDADDELLRKASCIKIFEYVCSKLSDGYGYESDEYDCLDVQAI